MTCPFDLEHVSYPPPSIKNSKFKINPGSDHEVKQKNGAPTENSVTLPNLKLLL